MKRIMFCLMAVIVVLTTACKDDDGDSERIIPVTGITLDQTELTVAPGLKKILKAFIMPEDATNKAVTWSSNNPAIEIDDTTGEMTVIAITENPVAITAITVDGGFTASVAVSVVDIPAIGVSLEEGDVVVGPGRKKTISAIVKPNAAANKNVAWESDNEVVASIDRTTGEITAHAEGVTKITVTTEDGGFKASCHVRVPYADNLLQNPSFEDGTNAAPAFWTKLPQDWFNSYYVDPGSVAVNESQTNRIGPSSDAFFTGNGAFFTPHLTGEYTGRIQGNQTGGMYQIVTVTPGSEYWISIDIGWRNNNANTSMKTGETVKILSPDGAITYHEALIAPPGPTTGNGQTNVMLNVSGYFTVPTDVTQVRFQFDQRSYANPNQSPLALFDNCGFHELPILPE